MKHCYTCSNDLLALALEMGVMKTMTPENWDWRPKTQKRRTKSKDPKMKTQRWRPENKDLFIFFIYYDLVMVSLQKYPVLVLIFPTMIKYAIKHWFFDKRTLKIKTQTPRPEKQKPEKEHLKRNTWKKRLALIFFYWKWSNVSVMCSPLQWT